MCLHLMITQGEDLAAVLVDRVQPRKTIHDEDAVMGRCYETSDGRWYGTEQLSSCKGLSCRRVFALSFD